MAYPRLALTAVLALVMVAVGAPDESNRSCACKHFGTRLPTRHQRHRAPRRLRSSSPPSSPRRSRGWAGVRPVGWPRSQTSADKHHDRRPALNHGGRRLVGHARGQRLPLALHLVGQRRGATAVLGHPLDPTPVGGRRRGRARPWRGPRPGWRRRTRRECARSTGRTTASHPRRRDTPTSAGASSCAPRPPCSRSTSLSRYCAEPTRGRPGLGRRAVPAALIRYLPVSLRGHPLVTPSIGGRPVR
jgi:hypothetical protein